MKSDSNLSLPLTDVAILRPTLWLLTLLAEIGQADYMALNCPMSSFAAARIAVANVIYG